MGKWIKIFVRLIYMLVKVNLKGWSRKEQDHVVWVKIWGLRYFLVAESVNTLGIINALSEAGVKFNIRFGNNIGGLFKKRVYFAFSRRNDPYKFRNYTSFLRHTANQLERQHCITYPNSYEINFWENKSYMHGRFDELNISAPSTYMLESVDQVLGCPLKYPFLIKEEHSYSSNGLHKITSEDDLRKLITPAFFERNDKIIAQQLLNMRKDLRVTFVGSEIVLHYWRINLAKEWKPTATSFGSDVDFVFFPEKWRQFITDEFRKLGLRTGAFDVAWENDDLDTTPKILEVSPVFQPNPPVDLAKEGFSSYADFKYKVGFAKSYEARYVDIVYDIARKQIALALSA